MNEDIRQLNFVYLLIGRMERHANKINFQLHHFLEKGSKHKSSVQINS